MQEERKGNRFINDVRHCNIYGGKYQRILSVDHRGYSTLPQHAIYGSFQSSLSKEEPCADP